ncbi:hypothetical protein FRC09_001139 [Ceratobasidium sp. 395]|nr:hypothetical protein FRC09_001139 [Ceratobasidium sp. 395]
MANPLPDDVYSIQLPYGNNLAITDPGEGRWVHLLPEGEAGPDAHKIKIVYHTSKGAYALIFRLTDKYLRFDDSPSEAKKLVDGDEPRFFKIAKHEYYPNQYVMTVLEDRQLHIGVSSEQVNPPEIALREYPEKQPWVFKRM